MTRNFEILKNFIASKDEKSIFVNIVNEGITCFYKYLAEFYGHEYVVKNIADTEQIQSQSLNNDLFNGEQKIIYIYEYLKIKDIQKLIQDVDKKKIIFSEYQIFKKIKLQHPSLNAYNFEKDLKYFLTELKITNFDLLNFLLNNPEQVGSELVKYQINPKGYISPIKKNQQNELIDLRKKIRFEKMENKELKSIYNLIKMELITKKFNFLAF